MSDHSSDRREFIKLAGKAAALSAVFGGGAWFLSSKEYMPPALAMLTTNGNRGIASDGAFPDLVSVEGTDCGASLKSAIDNLGGISRFISKGDIVTIKPNIGWDRTAEQGANTNPILVRQMALLCIEAGAKKVIVTDIPCNEARRTFVRSGISESLKDTGADLILPENQYLVDVDLGGEILGVWPVQRQFLECDKLINMPVVKHHSLSKATIGLKNWYGVLGGPRNRLHQQIDTSIADLASYFTPTLVIVDATRVMLRNGPVGGRLTDVETRDTVIAGTDQVAADSYSCGFLNLKPTDLEYLALAESRGLGKTTGYNIEKSKIA